jgi:glycosyltransferase involved in cell wall biosynthesis
MRVLLDATYAARAPYSGTGVYVDRITEALRRLGDVEVEVVANGRRREPAGGGIGSVRNLIADRWWTAVELPRLARRLGADVIHHPLPALARASRVPQVITVHDLAFERLPDQFDRRFRLYAHRTHRAAALAAGAVICVSETAASDVRELWCVPPERIVVALHGPGQEVVGRELLREHFLYVGDDEPRKNLATLLAAYRRYRERVPAPLPLLLAGAASADGPGMAVERHPSRERLAELYAGAIALVLPSLYEGFGLTALEAMSAGTPVLAARSPGLLEVCADAASYADPRDPESFAEAMVQISQAPALQAQLGELGRRRAARFSWGECARAHVDAYSLAQKRA